jgi:hypothetical protein
MLRDMTTVLSCLAVLVAAPVMALAAPGGPKFPYADMNNNGVYDAGDVNIGPELRANGYYSTTESVVFPAGVEEFKVKPGLGLTVSAGKNITIDADIYATGGGSSIALFSEDGSITLGRGHFLRGGSAVYLNAGHDVVLGQDSAVRAWDDGGLVMVSSTHGHLLMLESARLRAPQGMIDILVPEGNVTLLPGAELLAGNGSVAIAAGGDVVVTAGQINAETFTVQTAGHLVDFKRNVVQAPRSGGFVMFHAAGSTIDVRGSQFRNIDADSLVFDAPTVLQ